MSLCLSAVLPCRVGYVSARLPPFLHRSLNFCFMLLWEVMGGVGQSREGARCCPGDQWGREPPPSLSGLPCQTGESSPQSIPGFPALAWPAQLESTSGRDHSSPGIRGLSKHMAASACIVSVLCFYIDIYISIILLKKGKIILSLSLGKAVAVGTGECLRKGVGQLVQGGTFLLDSSVGMPSQA